jgi:hypothetical protein
MVVFWVVAPCSLEAARTSETLVNFYQTTRRYNSEDSNLRTHRRENFKSYNQTCANTNKGCSVAQSVKSGEVPESFALSSDLECIL